MSKKFVHSTCGQPMVFTFNEPVPKDSKEQTVKVIKEIRIGGGAWVLNAETRVPKVVITEVTDEELALLESNESFCNMKRRGFITVREENHGVYDSRDLPEDMEKKDNSSQILDEDHAKGTDPRLEHEGTRATYGENNQFGGMQPESVDSTDYGPIRLS